MRLQVTHQQFGNDGQDVLEGINAAINPLADDFVVAGRLKFVLREYFYELGTECPSVLFVEWMAKLSTVSAEPI